MTKSDGKWFEQKTFDELKKLHLGSELEVLPSQYLKTPFGTQQVDAHVKGPQSADFIIFECKDEGTVGRSASRQAEGIMKDVGAQKAVIVGNGKFTRDLIKRCTHYGIDVITLVDTDEKRLRTSAEFEIISSFSWVSEYTYRGIFSDERFDMEYPPQVIKSNYTDETVHAMVCNLWNEGVLDRTSGAHVYDRNKFEALSAKDYGLILQPVDGIEIAYKVERKNFLHKAPIANGSGVLDVIQGKFTPTSPLISVGPLSIEQIVNEGQEISDKELSSKAKQVGFIGDATYIMT